MDANVPLPCEQVTARQSILADLLPAPDPATLPLVRGRLHGELSWYLDRDNDPSVDVAECRLIVACPFCGRQHTHGWKLSGHRRTEIRAAHCSRGCYRVRPSLISHVEHEHSPYRRIERPARRPLPPAEPWPPRLPDMGIVDCCAQRGRLILAVLKKDELMDFFDAIRIAKDRAWAAAEISSDSDSGGGG